MYRWVRQRHMMGLRGRNFLEAPWAGGVVLLVCVIAAVVAAIKEAVDIPVVADIHFDYRAALAALDAGATAISTTNQAVWDM